MKSQPRFVLVATLAATSSLAASPDAGALAAVGSDAGALAAVARSGAAAAQKDQIEGIRSPETFSHPSDLGTITGEKPFEFKPTKDFPILSLTDADMEAFNKLGEDLVRFARGTERRIDETRTEYIGKIRSAASAEAAKAGDVYRKALEERIRAGNALNDLKLERERAETAVKAAQAKAAEARKGVERVEARIAEVAKDKQALDRLVKERADEAARAGQAGDRADKEHAAAKDAVSAAEKALADARDALKKAGDLRDGAAKERDGRKAGLEAAGRKLEAADQTVAGKRGACDAAKEAERKAARAQAQAKDALSAAERALRDAKDGVLDAEDGVKSAERRVEKAAAAVAAAKEAEGKGWFTRLFAPSPDGAKASADKAAEALRLAKESKTAAEKAVPAAERAVETARKVLADADKALGGRKTAVADADKALADAKEARKQASRARDEADEALSGAEKALRKAQRDVDRRADEEAGAGQDLAKAQRTEKNAADAAAAAAEAARQAAAAATELRDEKDATAAAGLVNRGPLEAAKAREVAANKELEAREKALKDMGDNSGRVAILEEKAKVAENKWREALPAFQAGQRRLDATNVRTEANRQVVQNEERLKKEKEEAADVVWNKFLDAKIKAARPKAGRAVAEAPKRVAEAQKAAETARADYETAKTKAAELGKAAAESNAFRAARKADESARAALARAEKAVKRAQGGEDAAAIAKAREELETCRKSAEKAAKSWQSAQQARSAAIAKAREAEEALPDLKAKAENAGRAAAQAEKDERTVRRNLEKTESRVKDAVAELREMFDEQVAAASKPGVVDPEWEGVGRTAAQRARSRYYGLRGGRDAALKAWRGARDALAARLDAEGTAQPFKNRSALQSLFNACEATRADLAKKREAFDAAEDEFNKFFSEADFRTDLSISDEAVSALYDSTNRAMSRTLYWYDGESAAPWTVHGDRRWLARTSVNGENLLDVLQDEFAWQAELLVDAGEAKRDPYDPLRVVLSADQAADCAAAAAAYAKRRAIYGGYYFCGIDADPETHSFRVDKGRFGPAVVHFVDAEGNVALDTNNVEVVDGRMYTADDILARFASKNAPTNTLEGETFNFIAFQKAFNKLNADPDIKKADVVFDVSNDFAYNYDRDQGWGVEDVDATNTMTRAVKAVIDVRENRRPAPLHGVLSVDNFNSMGDTDKIAGDADTWMARLQLQRRLGLFSRDDALSLSGNVSLGGSLWGVAGSYFVPRDEDARLWRRGELADSFAWTLHGGYTDVDQSDVIKGLDVLGTGYYAGLQTSTRLFDSGRGTWDASLGFTWRYVENAVEIDGEEIKLGPNGDGYTILPLSLALLYADKDLDAWRGRNFATFELSYNLGGSSQDDLSAFRKAIDNDRYAILRAQLARLQLLWEGSEAILLPRMLFLKADAQWALDPVIGAEQFGLGGHGTVRGYAERQFMGDQGLAVSAEFRTPILLNPGWIKPRRNNPYAAGEQLQLVYFVDAGWYNLEKASSDGDEDNALVGLGLGLRYSADDLLLFGREISPVFRLDWAWPVWQQTNLDNDEKSSAGVIHASLQFPF